VNARVDTAVLAGVRLDTIGLSARFDSLTHGRFGIGALSHNGPTLATAGNWSVTPAARTLVVDSMALTVGADDWRLAQPVRLAKDSAGVRIDSLVLRNRDTAVVVLSANVPDVGPVSAQLSASRIPLGEFAALAQFRDTVSGVADVLAGITGTKSSPRIAASASLTSLKVDGFPIDSIALGAAYGDRRLNATGHLVRGGQTALSAQADLPIEIALFSAPRKIPGPLSGELHADTTDLSIVSTLLAIGGMLTPGTIDSVMGKLSATARLSGKWGAELFNGNVAVRNGSAVVRPMGVKIVDINGSIFAALNAAGTQDSIAVKFTATNDKQPSGSLQLDGWFNLPATSKTSPSLDLRLVARQFHALNKRSLADLYISTDSTPLRLHGTLRADTLEGSLRVDRGAIYLADRDLARKLVVEEVVDSTSTSGVTTVPSFLTTLITNLQGGVTITLGDNVRLRSSEANVRLTGTLNLRTSTARSTRATASGTLIPKLSLEGQLRTVDGTYVLNLGVVQREFAVLPDGVVTFDGPPETPTLDINALYNVKQYRDRDIGVIVNLHGRMPNPNIDFKSTTEYAISQSDLVSYLITGRPGLDLGGANNTGASQVLANVLAPTLSAVAAAGLRQNLGSWFDMLQFQLGSADNATGQNPFDPRNFSQYLNGATIGAEKQFGGNLYFNLNTGLCGFTQNTSNFTALGSLGAKVEYRFDPTLSAQVAYDPPTANRICSRESQLLTGFQPTPGQFSFSLSHTWRF
jgi:hypothetical protein